MMDCPESDRLNPIFLPNYSECNKYFMCFNGTKIARECADGLVWSREREWCDSEEFVICGNREDINVEEYSNNLRSKRLNFIRKPFNVIRLSP
jgi:uncharacterized CHY-type Zn-finger protein